MFIKQMGDINKWCSLIAYVEFDYLEDKNICWVLPYFPFWQECIIWYKNTIYGFQILFFCA